MKCCKYPLSEIKNKIIASEGEELLNISTYDNNILKSFKINEIFQILVLLSIIFK